MDRLCQYSTIILAGNVCVLLTVAIMTDYWQYRGFRALAIQTALPHSNTTHLLLPDDTDSYFVIRYTWDARGKMGNMELPGDAHRYEPPVLLHRFYRTENVTTQVDAYNGTHNVTLAVSRPQSRRTEDVIVLFVQYGNLFRDCDNLEVGVRRRLGLSTLQTERCFNFITSPRDDYIQRNLPAVTHLERGAFSFAVLCIIASVASVVSGAYGSMLHEKTAILAASWAALISGMSLTIAIALFHGKCHLIQRREFMDGVDVPYKRLLNNSREQRFGWSFILAWICVALCFIHAWVWLHKAQDMRSRSIRYRVKTSRCAQKQVAGFKYIDGGLNSDELTMLSTR